MSVQQPRTLFLDRMDSDSDMTDVISNCGAMNESIYRN